MAPRSMEMPIWLPASPSTIILPVCSMGPPFASQAHEIHTQARAQAAARIALDPDRLALSQGLHHPSKADASYGSVHIQPRSKVLPVEVEGTDTSSPDAFTSSTALSPFMVSLNALEGIVAGQALGEVYPTTVMRIATIADMARY